MSSYDVFISYSRRDYVDSKGVEIPDNMVSRIKKFLEDHSYTYWFDENGIYSGDDFVSVIADAIDQSRIFLFLSTKASNESKWTCNEIATAKHLDKIIIPFRVDNSKYSKAVLMYLAPLDYIDYANKPKKAFDALSESIQHHLRTLKEIEIQREQEKERTLAKLHQEELRKQQIEQEEERRKLAAKVKQEKLDEIESKITDFKKRIEENRNQRDKILKDMEALKDRIKDCEGEISSLDESINVMNISISSLQSSKLELTGEVGTDCKGNQEPSVASPTGIHDILQPRWSAESSNEIREIIRGILDNMILVEGGTFMMGATPEQKKWACKDEKPAHQVTLSSYYICKFLVTQKEWSVVMGNNPSKNLGEEKAVDGVSKIDCDKFVTALRQNSGIHFDLPTEAQWEFAARGGNYSKGYIYSGSDSLDEVGWNFNNGKPDKIGMKKPNELGIYDMSGYLSEWCCEEKGKYTDLHVVNPKSIYEVSWFNQNHYVIRGGDYLSNKNCRVSYRACFADDCKSNLIGCRLVVNIEQEK